MSIPYWTANEIAGQHARIKEALRSQPSWGLRDGRVKEWLNGTPTTVSITDIGSGIGELESQLFQLGYKNVTSVDIDNYLDPELMGGTPTFVKADVTKDTIGIADASQDVVFALQMFEHLENPWHCAREILRITKPGGRIIVSIPHATSFINRWKFLWTGNVDTYGAKNNHIALFSNALFRLLWKNQVKIQKTDTAEGYIKLWGGKKLRFKANTRLGRMFTRKIAYVLERV